VKASRLARFLYLENHWGNMEFTVDMIRNGLHISRYFRLASDPAEKQSLELRKTIMALQFCCMKFVAA
jgi:hypothetical protein